jgi:hypothetical protein
MRRGKVYLGFWFRGLKERGELKDQGIDVSITLKWVINRMGRHGLE